MNKIFQLLILIGIVSIYNVAKLAIIMMYVILVIFTQNL